MKTLILTDDEAEALQALIDGVFSMTCNDEALELVDTDVLQEALHTMADKVELL